MNESVYNELLKIKEEEETKLKEETAIADLLTYFDCTDYVDFEGNPVDKTVISDQ
jgi:rRNA-processing protein FCF1